MEQNINLKKLERDTAAVVFKTGIVDIGIGLVLLVSALAMLFDDIRYYIDILFIVPIIFIFLANRYVVIPRMGFVEFSKKRVKRSMLMIFAITTFLVVMVAMTFLNMGSNIGEILNPRWIITGIIFFICVSVAYFFEFWRMYLYAFVMAGAFNFSEIIRDHPGFISDNSVPYFAASLLLIMIGIYYFISFLKKYPLPSTKA